MKSRIIIKEVTCCSECPYCKYYHNYNKDWENGYQCWKQDFTRISFDDEERAILRKQEAWDALYAAEGIEPAFNRPVSALDRLHPTFPLPFKNIIITSEEE